MAMRDEQFDSAMVAVYGWMNTANDFLVMGDELRSKAARDVFRAMLKFVVTDTMADKMDVVPGVTMDERIDAMTLAAEVRFTFDMME